MNTSIFPYSEQFLRERRAKIFLLIRDRRTVASRKFFQQRRKESPADFRRDGSRNVHFRLCSGTASPLWTQKKFNNEKFGMNFAIPTKRLPRQVFSNLILVFQAGCISFPNFVARKKRVGGGGRKVTRDFSSRVTLFAPQSSFSSVLFFCSPLTEMTEEKSCKC